MTKQTDDVRAAVLAAPRPADAARALSMPGKTFRDVLRTVFGVYVSQDPTLWDARLRAFAFAYVQARGNAAQRATIKAAWVAGDDAPPEQA
jgi:hypothetical protein